MANYIIKKSTLQFLNNLASNNNRQWFQSNKQVYEAAHENMIAFADHLLIEMNKHDELATPTGKKALFRIYRDVRFSKNKLPYKNHFDLHFQRATQLKRGGYYLSIQPGKSFLGVGFFQPNPDDLARIRYDISWNYEEWFSLLGSKKIKANFGEMDGETVQTAPRGYDKNHPAIELLRYKSFTFSHHFSDKDVLDSKFINEVNRIFKSIRPWFDYMSEVLTTDNNGELIV